LVRIFVFIIVFFSFFDLFTQLPIMSPFATSLGASTFLTGLVVGMYSFSNTIGNLASGFLTDKRGPYLILFLGLSLSGGSLTLYSFVDDPWMLLLVRFIHGLTAGLIVPAAFTYLANTTPKEKKGKGSAVSGAFVGLAAVIGPAFSGIVASKTSEATVLAVTAVIMITLAVLSIFFLQVKQTSTKKKEKTPQSTEQVSWYTLFKNGTLMKTFLGSFFLMFSQGVLAYMLPLKVMELGFDTKTSGLLMSTFGIVAICIFLLPTNRLFDIIPSIYTLAFGMAMMGLGLLLISFTSNITLLYVVMGVYGIGFSFLFPSLNSLLIESTDASYRGKAYGYFYSFFSIGVVVGSGVTGFLGFNADQGLLFTGCLLIIVALAFLYHKNKQINA